LELLQKFKNSSIQILPSLKNKFFCQHLNFHNLEEVFNHEKINQIKKHGIIKFQSFEQDSSLNCNLALAANSIAEIDECSDLIHNLANDDN